MQNRRGLIFLGLAIIMGLAAAWVTSEFSPKADHVDVAAAHTTPVVVVRSDIPVASSLTIAQLKLVDWPSSTRSMTPRVESFGIRSHRESPFSQRRCSRSAQRADSVP